MTELTMESSEQIAIDQQAKALQFERENIELRKELAKVREAFNRQTRDFASISSELSQAKAEIERLKEGKRQ
jgi:hypothetical protein